MVKHDAYSDSPNRLPEYFDLEHVGNNLLSLSIQVGMHNSDVV